MKHEGNSGHQTDRGHTLNHVSNSQGFSGWSAGHDLDDKILSNSEGLSRRRPDPALTVPPLSGSQGPNLNI